MSRADFRDPRPCDLYSGQNLPLTETLGPEDAYALMDKVYEILIHKVHDFEGTVNEMTGDGALRSPDRLGGRPAARDPPLGLIPGRRSPVARP